MGSVLWRVRRWWWYINSDRRCEDCHYPLVLHARDRTSMLERVLTVHHVGYRRLGRERREDVALLCWPCHCRRDSWRRRYHEAWWR